MGYTSFSFAPDENLVIDKILKYICDFVVVVCLALFFVNFFCQGDSVVGNSMAPTLKNDEKILVNTLAYSISSPERGDVVVFDVTRDNGESNRYIKRIVGLPGDDVSITGGELYINGEKYPLISKENIVNAGNIKKEITLEDGEYFVIGDNVNNSEDSRFSTVGLVDMSMIVGKAWMVAAPFKDIKFIK